MAMPLVHRRIGREAVEVAVALDVPDPDALAAGQHDVERLVVVGAEFSLDIEEVLEFVGHVGGSPLCTHVISCQQPT